jgi:hypothetical protein
MQVFKNNVEVLYTMSRVEANILLDWLKQGHEMPRHLVDWALFVTGDNAPYRCAEGYAQGLTLINHT